MPEDGASPSKIRVYYLGSGNLGIAILDALRADGGIELVGIGSQPDRPVGRKHRLAPTPFARHALESGLEVDRLPSVNTPEFLEKLRTLGTEILLVVAFGQLLKQELLSLPPFGCLNVHASLLPRYRGACPINAAILNGDKRTGVSFMRMERGLDTGPVYHMVELPILETETTEELEERLGLLAASRIGGVLRRITREGLQPTPQPPTDEPNVRKICKEDGAIPWNASARRISNMVRAYQPWPRAYTCVPVQGELRRIQITEATCTAEDSGAQAGQVLPESGKALVVACGAGTLLIHRLIPDGKKEMSAADFLRGNPVMPGSILE
ncbi:MAG: methionyl-tRNA formyltransferase [Oligosphaeraceae bacterium]